MTTDFKALSAELLAALEIQLDELAPTNRLCKRARAALAEGAATDAASRVVYYLEQRRLIRGLDPEEIHGLHAGTDEPRQATLTVSDLEALIRTPPRPIPVAERLPTEADCDAKGKVWTTDYDPRLVYSPEWSMTSLPPQLNFSEAYFWRNVRYWLPAAAIPLPEGENDA